MSAPRELILCLADPGAIVGRRLGPSWTDAEGKPEQGYREQQETLVEWQARAVQHWLTSGLDALALERGGGKHALRQAADRQDGELNAIEMVRRLVLVGDWRTPPRPPVR